MTQTFQAGMRLWLHVQHEWLLGDTNTATAFQSSPSLQDSVCQSWIHLWELWIHHLHLAAGASDVGLCKSGCSFCWASSGTINEFPKWSKTQIFLHVSVFAWRLQFFVVNLKFMTARPSWYLAFFPFNGRFLLEWCMLVCCLGSFNININVV